MQAHGFKYADDPQVIYVALTSPMNFRLMY